jgi:TolB-like protein/DNA-binding SARP family transcriptional activator/Tfp pilus assembly protein PilF
MALLALVARAGSRGITRDRLQSILWPDADDEQGKAALKQALYALRRDAGVDELFVGTRDLCLNPDEVRCDVIEFEELRRRNEFERAVAVYDGPFLDGFRLSAVPEFESWVEDERQVLEQALAGVLDRLAQLAIQAGDAQAAVRWNRRRVVLEPLNAHRTIDLMQALLAAGDRAGALQQARIYEELIAQELDLSPDERVAGLAKEIRAGRIGPAPASASPAPPASSAPAGPATPPAPHGRAPDETLQSTSAPAMDPPHPMSVAIIPLTTIASDADAGLLCDGLTEELITALNRMQGLRISGGLSGRRARENVPHDVAAILEGSVRRVGDDIRVTVRLLRAGDGLVLWTERYDRQMEHVLALEDELARAVAEGVDRALRQNSGLPRAPSARERADVLYAAGMRAWTPQGAGLGQGLEQFREAIAIDPEHARAHAALAESYTQLAFYGFLPARRAAELAATAARTAMALAPDTAESHLARGTCLLWVDREFDAGTAELERALEIDPGSVVAQARLAFVRLCHDGPVEAERTVARRAATGAGATGLSRVMYGQQLLAVGRYDEAVEALHAAIDIEAPSFLAYHWLCAAYVQKEMGAEAVAAAVAEASLSDRHPWSLMSLVVACALAGQRVRAERLLATLTSRAATGYVQASVLGLAHAALGDVDAGMTFLEQAVQQHDPSMMMLRTFPMFAPFRAHPRFRPLLHTAGWRDWDTAEFRVPDASTSADRAE